MFAFMAIFLELNHFIGLARKLFLQLCSNYVNWKSCTRFTLLISFVLLCFDSIESIFFSWTLIIRRTYTPKSIWSGLNLIKLLGAYLGFISFIRLSPDRNQKHFLRCLLFINKFFSHLKFTFFCYSCRNILMLYCMCLRPSINTIKSNSVIAT
jgi:hypothetical protein